ncbi:MAG: acryloyl-CoA reductase [Bacillus sp. (in: Bacteria)]|nr:acryloyl-CoA reductase [Bacillus sp. (in: firmicutes)]
MESFKALVVDKLNNETKLSIQDLTLNDLPDGDVVIDVHYSSVNYKDGLATVPNGGVVRNYPFVPGIDLAGIVRDSQDPRYKPGDEVIITGYDLGVNHFGGYSEVARVPGDWIVPLPNGLTLKEAMAIGTAGFTAALSIHRLEENGLTSEKGPVLVTGATGGVGSSAVSMLSKLGYKVTASSRKANEQDYLLQIGASEIITPEELTNPKNRPLLKQRWAACVDPVAGSYLPVILASIQYGGSVAVSGLTGGNNFTSTVFPFILRGVNLLGIDSVFCPMETRLAIWERLAGEMKPNQLLESIANEVTLEQLPEICKKILNGELKGRTIVTLK